MSDWPQTTGSFNFTQDFHWYNITITSTGDGLPLGHFLAFWFICAVLLAFGVYGLAVCRA
ncbi:hypothetical protein FA15DRAFT_711914 [Coprinopsis marcescibilis]|uniref:Uncharacterized protein n=1 Tax=Coprinopsis marcescibilis TaxID=230819 RepID=A0A5C3K8I9_COPMA|nr:hypothetical protein FA15DRAFT_711914 [Coprinopsis marcescibilis]